MGHNIEYYDYPEKVNKAEVNKKLDNYAAHRDWEEGCSGLYQPIRWLDAEPLDSYDAAVDYIKSVDQGWYDQVAVRYKADKRCPDKLKLSKKLAEMYSREKASEESLNRLISSSSVKNRQSEYIGCPACGSKLNREKLRGEKCPLCGIDLRSQTMQSRIQNAQKKLTMLRKDIAAQVKKENNSSVKPGNIEIRWLVKIEYHT